MYPTKNDLPEATRRKMIELCNARLADAIDLQTQTKQAHWNVKGPHFIALHELFDKVNQDVEDYVDLIAERAVQLGGTVQGTARSVAKRSTLAEYPLKIAGGRQHADALSSALAAFGKAIRASVAARRLRAAAPARLRLGAGLLVARPRRMVLGGRSMGSALPGVRLGTLALGRRSRRPLAVDAGPLGRRECPCLSAMKASRLRRGLLRPPPIVGAPERGAGGSGFSAWRRWSVARATGIAEMRQRVLVPPRRGFDLCTSASPSRPTSTP